MRKILSNISVSVILFLAGLLFAEDYSFDFEEYQKKPYEYVGTIQVQSDFSKFNHSSELYKLSFLNKEKKKCSDSYLAFLQLKGSYEISEFKLYADIKDQLAYTINDEFDNTFSIYEAFINADISTNIDLLVGKKSIKWGKGYIWNPVSFVGRQKDINDVDAGLEGFWMVKLDYVKSLSGALQNYTITPVIIPVKGEINEDFAGEDGFNFILNNYLLMSDTDIDFYLFYHDSDLRKLGADFARNIFPNWEIHAEYVFEKKLTTISWDSNSSLESDTTDGHHYLFGTRILFETNTTLIAEYFHNDAGFDKDQMSNFFETIEYAISQDPSLMAGIKQYQGENFNSQFLMRDYLYIKLSHPEPFDILYFTPSIFVLYNLNDKSSMAGGEFSYSRFENLSLKMKYNLLLGVDNTEFGEKTNSGKLSLQMGYTF
ncbi:MAG: hypothetical protein K8S56_05215 [Candidatus Cloacimonetes bacterium]|nr:hypothetical protein [Candidatus Cloacimonadota bacterium]